MDVFGAFEGVIVHPFAEATFVDVGGVEAGCGLDVGIHGGAEGEMAADADAHGSEVAGAVGARFEVVEDGACVGIVGGYGLGGLEDVAAVRAGLVVGEDGAGGLELVVDLGHGDDVAVAGEQGGGATDGGGDLEDLRVEDDAGVATRGSGADDVGAHGTAGGIERNVFVVDDDHGRLGESVGLRWKVLSVTPSGVLAQSIDSRYFSLGLQWQSIDCKRVICKVLIQLELRVVALVRDVSVDILLFYGIGWVE